jgi:hypothetical protein
MKKVILVMWDSEENQEWPAFGLGSVTNLSLNGIVSAVGDEVLLLKRDLGIIGHGFVENTSAEKLSNRNQNTQELPNSNNIPVRFDWILSENDKNFIPYDLLEVLFPEQTFPSENKAVEVHSGYIDELKRVLQTVPGINIDFAKITSFLRNFGNQRYTKYTNSLDDKYRKEQIASEGRQAKEEFNRFGEIISQMIPGFKMTKARNWQNSGNVVNYFWLEFQKEDFTNLPHSISISINKYPEHNPSGDVTLSVRVEANDNRSKNDPILSEENVYKAHNSIIKISDLPDSSYFYQVDTRNKKTKAYSNSSEFENNSNEIKKIKIVKNIDGLEEKNNSIEIITQTIKAFSELIRFYDYILSEREALLNDDNKSERSEGMEQEYTLEKSINVDDKNIILYGPPGTGKTYNTVYYSVAICEQKPLSQIENEEYREVLRRFNKYKNENRIAFTTFHQSYGYEEFIEGIRPIMSEDNDNSLKYKISSGVFKEFCDNAGEIEDPCVFIIDEINRGNVSKIFGELITLIESTKRKGEEGLLVKLPYSKHEFGVPSNVYLLGTMNTADRSISLMDTALRRRFNFIEMLPDPGILKGIVIQEDGQTLNVAKMLELINKRIEFLFDREHTIGHAFFISMKNEGKNTIGNLSSIFKKSILPLLQEYFYDDYEKIRLVLGDDGKTDEKYQFIQKMEVRPRDIFHSSIGLENSPMYSLNEDAFGYISSYKDSFSSDEDNTEE